MTQQPHPPTTRTETPQPQSQLQGDATGGVIPYHNPHALIAYYLGVFSLIPILGLLPAIPALVLGIIGLAQRKKYPQIKGAAHAWIGIILGGLFTLAWGATVAIIMAAMIL